MNSRQEIISLLRGYAACPVLSHLGEQGLLDRMLQGAFAVQDFPDADPAVLGAVCRYLVGLGLLVPSGARYEVSDLGTRVFQRYGAFNILHSYRDFFDQLPDLLTGRASEAGCPPAAKCSWEWTTSFPEILPYRASPRG